METNDVTLTQLSTADVWWHSIPSVDEPSADAEKASRSRKRASGAGVSRRSFVQGAIALGGALSLNGLQWLSGVKLSPAAATVGNEYTTCANYDNWQGYNNNSLVCVGAAYSYIYCGTDGWFKNGTFDGGNTRYAPVRACGNGLTKRNAWRWTSGGSRYRCADGTFSYYRSSGGWTTPVLKICSQWIGSA